MDTDDFLQPGGAFGGALAGGLLDALQRSTARYGAEDRIGAFRLIEEIGRGGSSVVFLAERCNATFEQRVALKIAAGDAQWRALVERERNHLARLSHPAIARIIDGGETDAGDLWLAMEHVDGLRIDQWCERHAPDWRRRCELLIAICDAVQYAHTRMIAHGDLKPANVVVDARGAPHVLDFGISQTIGSDECAGGFTPGYASPEQIAGDAVGVATDVYQLACIARDLLSPAVPMPRLVRRNLQAIVERGMAVDPAARHAGARDLAEALQQALRGRPLRGQRWDRMLRLAFFALRHRRALVLSALLLCAAGWFAQQGYQRLAAERAIARRQELAALELSRLNSSLLQESLQLAGDRRDDVHQALQRRQQRVLADAHGDPLVKAALLSGLGKAFSEIGHFDDAKLVLQDAIALKRASGSEDLELAQYHCRLATSLHFLGEFDAAVGAAAHSRMLLERGAAGGERADFLARSCLGNALVDLGDYHGARALLDQSLVDGARLYGRDSVEYVDTLAYSAELARRMFDIERAAREGDAVLAGMQRLHGDRDPRTRNEFIRVQGTRAARGDAAGAERALRDFLAGSDPDAVTTPYQVHAATFYRAEALQQLGRWREAADAYAAALQSLAEFERDTQGPHWIADNVRVATFESVRGAGAAAAARLREALRLAGTRLPEGLERAHYRRLLAEALLAGAAPPLDEIAALLEAAAPPIARVYGEQSLPWLAVLCDRVELALLRGETAAARAALAAIVVPAVPDQPYEQARLAARIAALHARAARASGDRAAAQAALRRGVQTLAAAFGARHPETLLLQLRLADVSDDPAARALRLDALAVLQRELDPSARLPVDAERGDAD